jgi:DNA-binding GntR family transcriptional regulator
VTQLRVPTVAESVADWLAANIVQGRYTAGDRVREIEISEQLGVSRAPVREAIRILDAKGLVKHVPRIGAVVQHFSTETVMDVYELRAVVERWIAIQSVPALEPDELDQLDETLERMRAAEAEHDHDTFFEDGWRFRETLYSGSTNAVALDTVHTLRQRLHSLPQVLRQDERHVAESLDAYAQMAAAARRGDAEEVGRLVSAFMIRVGGYVCERYMDPAATAAVLDPNRQSL